MRSNRNPFMVFRAALLAGALCLAPGAASRAQTIPPERGTNVQPRQQTLDPELVRAIRQAPDGRADGIVYLAAQADFSGVDTIQDWERRGRFVLDTLQKVARNTQPGLIRHVAGQVRTGEAREYTPYYIVNAVFVRAGTLRAFQSIASLPGVRSVEKNRSFAIPSHPEPRTAVRLQAAPAWGVAKIGAPQAWSQYGARGQGIVVGNIDSGVNASHPALVQQYRGTATGSHHYNWYDATGTFPTAPGDDNNHGTHTMARWSATTARATRSASRPPRGGSRSRGARRAVATRTS